MYDMETAELTQMKLDDGYQFCIFLLTPQKLSMSLVECQESSRLNIEKKNILPGFCVHCH